MEQLPIHVCELILGHLEMDLGTLCTMACVSKTWKALCEERLEQIGKPSTCSKVMIILQDVLFRPKVFFKHNVIHICLMDACGRVRCWVTRSSRSIRPYYKLDGREDTPHYHLTPKQIPVFKKYLGREIHDVTRVSFTTGLSSKSRPVHVLRQRFRSVFPTP